MNKILKILLSIALFFVALTMYYNATINKTITIGIFTGSYWDVPDPNSYAIFDKAIERYEEAHPNIHITYESGIQKDDYSTWLSNKILSGEEPDIYIVLSDDFDTLSSMGALYNLDQLIEQDTTFSTYNYYESALNAGNYHDHQYALPYASNPTMMFVNETLLKKEGIEMPDSNWTIDDFYDICKKVTKDNNNDGVIDQYGEYNYTWENLVNAYGIQLFNEDGTNCYFNTYEMKNVLSYMKKLNSLSGNYIVSSKDFDEGNVAFYPLSFAEYRTYKSYPYQLQKYSTFKWQCIAMPSVKDTTPKSENSTLLLSMSSRTKHKEEAWDFLKYLSGDETSQMDVVEYSQGLSVLKSVTKSQDIITLIEEESLDNTLDLDTLNNAMELSASSSKFKKHNAALEKADVYIDDLLRNDEDVDLGLNTLQKEIKEYLQEQSPN